MGRTHRLSGHKRTKTDRAELLLRRANIEEDSSEFESDSDSSVQPAPAPQEPKRPIQKFHGKRPRLMISEQVVADEDVVMEDREERDPDVVMAIKYLGGLATTNRETVKLTSDAADTSLMMGGNTISKAEKEQEHLSKGKDDSPITISQHEILKRFNFDSIKYRELSNEIYISSLKQFNLEQGSEGARVLRQKISSAINCLVRQKYLTQDGLGNDLKTSLYITSKGITLRDDLNKGKLPTARNWIEIANVTLGLSNFCLEIFNAVMDADDKYVYEEFMDVLRRVHRYIRNSIIWPTISSHLCRNLVLQNKWLEQIKIEGTTFLKFTPEGKQWLEKTNQRPDASKLHAVIEDARSMYFLPESPKSPLPTSEPERVSDSDNLELAVTTIESPIMKKFSKSKIELSEVLILQDIYKHTYSRSCPLTIYSFIRNKKYLDKESVSKVVNDLIKKGFCRKFTVKIKPSIEITEQGRNKLRELLTEICHGRTELKINDKLVNINVLLLSIIDTLIKTEGRCYVTNIEKVLNNQNYKVHNAILEQHLTLLILEGNFLKNEKNTYSITEIGFKFLSVNINSVEKDRANLELENPLQQARLSPPMLRENPNHDKAIRFSQPTSPVQIMVARGTAILKPVGLVSAEDREQLVIVPPELKHAKAPEFKL